MLHFIVDGYNLIKRNNQLKKLELKSARQKSIEILQKIQGNLSSRNKITIVFDGIDKVYSSVSQTSVKVVFSRQEDADTLIKRMVEKESYPSRIVVVTADKAIIYYIKRRGARAMEPEKFLKKFLREKPLEREENIKIDYKSSQEINQELIEFWERKFKP